MNVFDVILYIALAWAVFNGWRRGFLLQMISLVAVVAALYLAAMYGGDLGTIFGMEGSTASIVGFITIFLAALLLVALGGYLVRAVFRFAGLGVLDSIVGIIFSVAKILLVVSVLYSWFAVANKDFDWASQQTVESSHWFKPVAGIAEKLTPYFDEIKTLL